MVPLPPIVKLQLLLVAPIALLLTMWMILRTSETTLRSEISAAKTELKSDLEKIAQNIRPPGIPQVAVQVVVQNPMHSSGSGRAAIVETPFVRTIQNPSPQSEARSFSLTQTAPSMQAEFHPKSARIIYRDGNVNMNVRSGTSSNENNIVGWVPRGAEINVIGVVYSVEHAGWYEVQCGGKVNCTKTAKHYYIPSLQTDQPVRR